MTQAGTGCSDLENSFEAANAATKQAMDNAGISKADWVLVFCTFPHRANYEEILKVVCEITLLFLSVGRLVVCFIWLLDMR